MLSDESEVVGPHVIVPTDELARVHVNGVLKGKYRIYECKYCGTTGTHPDAPGNTLAWRSDCGEFELLKSERVSLRER